MIIIDFSLALGIYLLIILMGLFLSWFFSKGPKIASKSLDPSSIWYCSVCTYTYVNTKQDNISTCPQCGSYNSKEDALDI